jgi:hypothetical protein
MLPVYLDITDEAKRRINKNVGCMFELLKCTCEGLSYAEILDDIYPPVVLETKLEKCTQTIKDMYNMTQDNYEREFLEPFHEWTLYHTILWWIDVAEDGYKLDEIPKEYCIDECGIDRHEYINDINNYLEFLFTDWDFLELAVMYSLYEKKPYVLKEFLNIEIEDYLELMPPDIGRKYKKLKERRNIMEKEKQIIVNINESQINMAKDNSVLNANQYNAVNKAELEKIVNGIMDNLYALKEEDADRIEDLVRLVKQELSEPEPKISKLKYYLTLIAPMVTIANGIPVLCENLQKLKNFIMAFISQ